MRVRYGLCIMAVIATTFGYLFAVNSSADDSEGDMLAVVLQGSKEAASSIKSGRGKITVHKWSKLREGGVLETETSYDVVFCGAKYKASRTIKYLSNGPSNEQFADEARIQPGTVARDEVVFDGVHVRWLDLDEKNGRIGDLETATGRHELMLWRTELGAIGSEQAIGYGVWDISAFHESLMFPGTKSAGPILVGRETIDGEECLVIEITYDHSQGSGPGFRDIRRFWVNPQRGYTVSRMRVWTEGGGYSARTLVAECEIKTKEYSKDLWGPSEWVSNQYDLDPQTNQVVQTIRSHVKFDEAFQLNCLVSNSELSLDFPSGTRIHDEVSDADYTVP